MGIINQFVNNPVWMLTGFFIVVAGLIVIGKGKGALLLSGIVVLALLARKYWPGGALEAFEDISKWLGRTEFGPETEEEKQAYTQLTSAVPSVGEIEILRKDLFSRLGDYTATPQFVTSTMSPGYTVALMDRLDHYFRLLYTNLHSVVYSDEYSQHNMVFAMETQHNILHTIHNFIFVDGTSSDMPPWLAKSRYELSAVFDKVNVAVAEYANSKNTQPNIINTRTGIINNVGEPLPNGTFRDKYQLY